MNILKNNYLRTGFVKRVRIQDANSKVDKCHMHACLRYSIRMCRWAGFFPVEGLDKQTILGIRYNLKGYYSIYYAATVLTGIVSVVLLTLYLMENELSIHIVSDFIFYTTGFISMCLFARLAKQWPVFMTKVAEIERHLEEIRTSNNTHKYCNAMACVIMVMALVEHLLAVIYGVSVARHCVLDSQDFNEIADEYFRLNFRYYFHHISYNNFTAFVFKIVNTQITFLWSFTDVLTICFSLYLISYFQDLNKFINKSQNDVSWEHLRAQYSRVVELVMQVDARLSGFILQSFVTYIFYICLQLFYTLNTTSRTNITACDQVVVSQVRQSPQYSIRVSYYVFSFLFLVLRFMITSLLAANVNLVAKKPLMALDAVPSAEYSLEVRRFRLQIEYNAVAMSGHFFLITRPMLLKVVGSIITYELVMLQLH